MRESESNSAMQQPRYLRWHDALDNWLKWAQHSIYEAQQNMRRGFWILWNRGDGFLFCTDDNWRWDKILMNWMNICCKCKKVALKTLFFLSVVSCAAIKKLHFRSVWLCNIVVVRECCCKICIGHSLRLFFLLFLCAVCKLSVLLLLNLKYLRLGEFFNTPR